MRFFPCIFAAALLTSAPAVVTAQSPAPVPTPPLTAPTPAQSAPTFVANVPSHWTASGFVGSEFGSNVSEASVDFGGQLGYLFNGIVGGELLADFAPKSKLGNALFANNPMLNTYMVNAMGAVPIGADARFQPYVSGGLGGIQLSADVLSAPGGSFTTSSQTKFGGDIGAGLMGFAGNFGLRADVRYYKAFTDNQAITSATTPADTVTLTQLSGLSFWRANVGVAVRW